MKRFGFVIGRNLFGLVWLAWFGWVWFSIVKISLVWLCRVWFGWDSVSLVIGFFEPAQQDWASLSQLEPAWAGKLNAVSWAWNSAQAGSIINFQIKLSSSWLNALSWRFSLDQAGSTIELGWVSLSQLELAQAGSSWIAKKRGKIDIFGQKIWFFFEKFVKYRPSSSWLKEKQLQLNLAQLLSSRSSQLKLAQSLSWVEPAQAGSIWLNTPWASSAQLSSKQPDRPSAQLNGWARCKMPAQRTLTAMPTEKLNYY